MYSLILTKTCQFYCMARSLEIRSGEVLRELRLERGMSQQELANAGELERTHISALERALRTPSLPTIFKLAEVLNIQPSEFVRLIEEKE